MGIKRAAKKRPAAVSRARRDGAQPGSGWIAIDGLELRPLGQLSERQIRKLDEMASEPGRKTFSSGRAAVRFLKLEKRQKALNSTLTERFLGACRSASPQEQTIIFQTILLLQRAFSQPHEHSGVGLRKLHPSEYWEIRFGLSLRGVLRLREDEAVLLFVGTHDEVRRFLKSV